MPTVSLVASYSSGRAVGRDAAACGCTLRTDGVYRDERGRVFVPEELRAAVLVAGHCGLGGHRGVKATLH